MKVNPEKPYVQVVASLVCITLLALLVAPGCSHSASGETPAAAGAAEPAPLTYEAIEPFFNAQCVVCHNYEEPDGAVDLSDYFLVTDFQEEIRLRVATDNMPPATSPQKLTGEEKQLILDWIAAGCPE